MALVVECCSILRSGLRVGWRAEVTGGQVVEAEDQRRRVDGVVGGAQQVDGQREAQAGRRQQAFLARRRWIMSSARWLGPSE